VALKDQERAPGVRELCERAKKASFALARASGAKRSEFLRSAAERLLGATSRILEANSEDVKAAEAQGMAQSAVDRLLLNEARIASMAEGLRSLAAFPDPVGEVVEGWRRPDGLRITRVRVPLGVVGVVYENRPNVTSDAAGLCIKAGNAVVLRGSASAIASNRAIASVLREALIEAGLPEDGICLVEDTSHEAVEELLTADGLIDCVIPRGGPALVSLVRRVATVPVVIDGDGNCHVYVDRAADLDMATEVVVNAKVQRPSVCNAAETLLVHEEVAEKFLPALAAKMPQVELRGDERTREILPQAVPATESDWATEFLSLTLAVRVVKDLEEAIEHIRRYSTGHSEAIVTEDLRAAERFKEEVDAAAVLVNASTRLVDGGELGLGAEIGISTQKLHARGPMGPRELTCVKFVIEGRGHIRT
jgi:glutamate-5-semialdehyde dehydrogenase